MKTTKSEGSRGSMDSGSRDIDSRPKSVPFYEEA